MTTPRADVLLPPPYLQTTQTLGGHDLHTDRMLLDGPNEEVGTSEIEVGNWNIARSRTVRANHPDHVSVPHATIANRAVSTLRARLTDPSHTRPLGEWDFSSRPNADINQPRISPDGAALLELPPPASRRDSDDGSGPTPPSREAEYYARLVAGANNLDTVIQPIDDPLFNELERCFGAAHREQADTLRNGPSVIPRPSIPHVSRAYVNEFRLPPLPGQPLCRNGSNCTCVINGKHKNSCTYVGRMFMLPHELERYQRTRNLPWTKLPSPDTPDARPTPPDGFFYQEESPDVRGMCIRCTLIAFSKAITKRSMEHLPDPKFPVNTFQVHCGPGEYSADVCWNPEVNHRWMGIEGFLPRTGYAHYAILPVPDDHLHAYNVVAAAKFLIEESRNWLDANAAQLHESFDHKDGVAGIAAEILRQLHSAEDDPASYKTLPYVARLLDEVLKTQILKTYISRQVSTGAFPAPATQYHGETQMGFR